MDFCLRKGAYGKALLEDDQVLMEIKSSGSIPLWLSSVLTHEHLFRTSYSKYGSAYQDKMLQQAQGGVLHA